MCQDCGLYGNRGMAVGPCGHFNCLVVPTFDGRLCHYKTPVIGAACAPARSEARTEAQPAPMPLTVEGAWP